MTEVNKTIDTRDATHGPYAETARIAQSLKDLMRRSRNWREHRLTAGQMEALEMIAHKMARVANGDPRHADSWLDIAGYATLGQRECTFPVICSDVLTKGGMGRGGSTVIETVAGQSELSRVAQSYGGTE